MKGWRKKCLPVAASFPCLPRGDGVTRRDLSKLQPMHKALQQLQQEGLIGVAPPADIFQSLNPAAPIAKDQDVVYPRPCCPDCPSSKELSVIEVNSWIHKVLDLGVNLSPRFDPAPLQGGLASTRVSTLGPILVAYAILSFHCSRDLA
jgi:hypothetical protein